MVVTVFMLFLTVSEQKSKVRLISEISYLASGQIRKLGNLGKIFSQLQQWFEFYIYLTVARNGSNCFHAFLDCFRAKE